MANVITTTINFVTDRAQSAVKGFRQSVNEAEGAVGKFRAGASSAMSTVQANAGNLALAGGAALVAFGTKAVAAFQDTAIAAGKFSDATGLAVEDASRLQEVAGDVGVEAASIEGAIVRMNAAAAKGDLEKFGVEIQRAADGTTDVNATFLEVIRTLEGIPDPTERALAAQKIFGRGYKEVAEIIFDSADNVAAKLGEVSEAKVISPDELEKAREFRESMDNLNDSLDDIKLAAGEALVPLLGDIAQAVTGAIELKGALEEALPGDRGLFETFNRATLGAIPPVVDAIKDSFDGGSESGGLFQAMLERMTPQFNEAGRLMGVVVEEFEELGPVVDRGRDSILGAGEAAETAADGFNVFEDGLQRTFDALGEIDDRLTQQDILANIADGWDDIAEAEEEAIEGGEAGRRDYERQVRDQRREVLRLVESIDRLPINKKIELSTQIETASLAELTAIVNGLAGGITVPVSFAPRAATETTPAMFTGGGGGITNPTFQQAAIPSTSIANITNIFPVGTTTTSQYILEQTDARRNGTRNPNIV